MFSVLCTYIYIYIYTCIMSEQLNCCLFIIIGILCFMIKQPFDKILFDTKNPVDYMYIIIINV